MEVDLTAQDDPDLDDLLLSSSDDEAASNKRKREELDDPDADDLLAEEDEDLRLDDAETEVWLVKVPKFLAEKWTEVAEKGGPGETGKQEEVVLGTIDVPSVLIRNSINPAVNRGTVTLPTTPWSDDIPNSYTLSYTNLAPPTSYIFTVNKPADRPKELIGRVNSEASIAPIVNDRYKQLMQARAKGMMDRKRPVQRLEKDGPAFTFLKPGMAGHGKKEGVSFAVSKKQSSQTDKKSRLEKTDLINLLFTAFEKYAHWNFKGLLERTHQPQAWLKEVLGEVAILNKRGPYVGLYELRPEFKGMSAVPVTQPAEGSNAGASTATTAAPGQAAATGEEEDLDEMDYGDGMGLASGMEFGNDTTGTGGGPSGSGAGGNGDDDYEIF
ncbi:transcription initiation factor IIF, beta subunit-domain-containing protein [Fimicolochytrium jonesii]|uniref:transcription initiation factor IIF, beta subunit-domain-containing protein n=1 Tax=Fimicolochytrium jonesii TaxID=1396493 RepID=UPI0022FECBA3|nr:transcription initiation factor IIF, beta subunit-domain-containing protein [Fimicolochytrium jonesii]KAI8823086.1 transcription initiation factor IIF, beta subunit-domain-containing protein [Fimicolochytrium jonesii]